MSNKRATNWGGHTNFEAVCRRASGRRHYNAVRQFRALMRQREIVNLLIESGRSLTERGVQSRIAATLGVHRSTVSRAIRQIIDEARWRRP